MFVQNKYFDHNTFEQGTPITSYLQEIMKVMTHGGYQNMQWLNQYDYYMQDEDTSLYICA